MVVYYSPLFYLTLSQYCRAVYRQRGRELFHFCPFSDFEEIEEGNLMGWEMGSGTRGGRGKWWRNRTTVAVVWVVVSMAICIGLHWYFRWDSMRKAKDNLVTMCDERARMLQEQFHVSVNHVHALAILVSTFHFQKQPTAMDQVSEV